MQSKERAQLMSRLIALSASVLLSYLVSSQAHPARLCYIQLFGFKQMKDKIQL